jgi:uncharacterized protein with HEPN domain
LSMLVPRSITFPNVSRKQGLQKRQYLFSGFLSNIYLSPTQKFTAKQMEENDEAERGNLTITIISLAEILNTSIPKDDPMREKFPKLFERGTGLVSKLYGQRNILAHQYGLLEPTIKWDIVWNVLTKTLPNKIQPELAKAIKAYTDDKGESASKATKK